MLLHIQSLLQLAVCYTCMQTHTHTHSSSLETLVFDIFLKRSILVIFHLNTVAITYPRPPVLWQIGCACITRGANTELQESRWAKGNLCSQYWVTVLQFLFAASDHRGTERLAVIIVASHPINANPCPSSRNIFRRLKEPVLFHFPSFFFFLTFESWILRLRYSNETAYIGEIKSLCAWSGEGRVGDLHMS